jgi:predicted tellurium resistance membrane protein TerC
METKPGVQTTEFWTMLFGQVVAVLQLTGAWQYMPSSKNPYVIIAMAVLGGLYAVGRGRAKQGVPYNPR